jgi:ribose transport system substrate-binding protein
LIARLDIVIKSFKVISEEREDNMKRKLLATFMSVAMIASLMAGCGASTADNSAAESSESAGETEEATDSSGLHFEIIVRSFQSTYWQAAVTGVDEAAEELGVTCNSYGPDSESDVEDQVELLKEAISRNPDGIGLAACDQEACLEVLQEAMDAGIPVVCFDSGIPDAPDGSVYATVATDNYTAGATAAENLYAALKDKIANADAPVRIGEVNQESASESIRGRGTGFIDKMIELAAEDGKTVGVTGNARYVEECSDAGDASTADIIIEVAVPAQTTVELCATEASVIMNKSDTIGMFGSNQVAAEGILAANESLDILSSDPSEGILAAGFDAGSVIKAAIKDGTMYGAVTQSPLAMGKTTVETLYKIVNGESVSDVPTEGYWYNADNMEDDSIAPNLYD